MNTHLLAKLTQFTLQFQYFPRRKITISILYIPCTSNIIYFILLLELFGVLNCCTTFLFIPLFPSFHTFVTNEHDTVYYNPQSTSAQVYSPHSTIYCP